MRSVLTTKAVATYASLAALAALSACADSTAPRIAPDDSAAFIVGPTAPAPGSTTINLASSSSTQFCSSATQIHVYTIPGSLAPIAGCGTAFDLTTALTTSYNPGWGAPLTGSAWIGPSATSNEYRTAPGEYVFQTTFTLPAGATSPVLNFTLLSDNAVAVYLNGFKVEQQIIQDCPAANKLAGTCNWQTSYLISDNNPAHFIIGGVNTITILLVDTPNGGTVANNYACTEPFQPFGKLGFGATPFNVPTSPLHIVANWTQTMTATTGCENPAGLDFVGTVSYVPASLADRGCSPGYWKNHDFSFAVGGGVTITANTTVSSILGPVGNTAIDAYLASLTLQEALELKGSGLDGLIRATVGAYLNALAFPGHFGETAAQVKADFLAVFTGVAPNKVFNAAAGATLKDKFEGMQDNETRTCTADFPNNVKA